MPSLKERYPLPVLAEAPDAWRSLEERRATLAAPEGEFPLGASEPPQGISRRAVLELAAFGAAAAGLSGCFRQPPEKVMPYSKQPPEVTPGVPLHYATGLTLEGYVRGLVVRSHEGRPTKVEGNPEQPESLGAAGAHEQASLLGLYDPHRARVVRHQGEPVSRAALFSWLIERAQRNDGGAGLRLLVEPSASPLWADTYARLLERYPRAKVVPFSGIEPVQAREGARLAFGRPLQVLPRFSEARTVVSLDDDFLSTLPGSPRTAREFVSARARPESNRLWVVESHLSVTGAFADHRLRARPSRLPHLARALAAEVGRALGHAGLASLADGTTSLSETERRWLTVAAKDLVAQRGAALVVAGARQPAAVHALAHWLNEALGPGALVRFVDELLSPVPDASALPALVEELRAGTVDTLIITAWNPVYRAPVDVPLVEALGRVPYTVYCALEEDETAAACTWFVPATHPYETWGDGRAPEGTATILQPLIAPLQEAAVAPLDLLAAFTGTLEMPPYERLRTLWRERAGRPVRFQEAWEGWLATGVVPGTELPALQARVDAEAVLAAARALRPAGEGLELHFVPDLKLYDGRFGANPWLQELPDPMTQLTWDNAALVSPATAARLGLERGSRVRLELRGRALEVAVLPVPGQADDTVTLPLGYGRTRGSPVAQGVGFNAYTLWHQDSPGWATGARLSLLEGHHAFALTQEHWRMEERPLALQTTQARFKAHTDMLQGMQEPTEHLYPPPGPPVEPPHRWGMAIDLHRCTGCSACVVACQAENNIPVVGKHEVLRGREMHWLRIDRYFLGDEHEPGVITQPLMCVHCEYAPCEYVCPVNATVHSDEGLNQMIYNRCIGTRYCSNNCPYKVRRFNYLDYTGHDPLARMHRNPQVTVRSRGVMEKCTYCVQRIESARITARVERRTIREGEVRTACQQACPTEAIVFGDLNRPESRVSQLHEDPRHYKLLHELGTAPRTVHLLRLKNPHEELG
ncbi:4Fe-4S dicluster domain-containing protein [Hyalangium minutum]|uniref:Molybdopterin oxidoreductase, iron-sulfur binding subunit protein n=1 Tax=Hyalangium minutum TaxID=394096 RepID=A0A085WAQ7_9BACT|nr:4Fe-4S dicluster domain-containing protein [Hyalangium minutum]KFE64770.1 Molybdopterin oxidoreductase, iron-sulfur binding subunit protein [Hyalangium minutum]